MPDSVSVIIPCRNGGAYLAEAIGSVLREGAGEIIVVDDGSEDDSAACASSFGGAVRLHRQPALGAAAARNAGIALANRDYIGFLDADDLWPSGSLGCRLGLLRQRPELAAVYGFVKQFHSADLDEASRDRIACPAEAQPGRLAGSMLFRRDVFARIGGFDVALPIGEMFDFIAKFTDAGLQSACVPDIVLARRIHARNMMRSGGAAHSGYLRSLKTLLDRRRMSPTPANISP